MKTFNLPELESKIYESCQNFVVIGAFDGESHDTFFMRILEKKNKKNNKIVFVEPVKKYYEKLLNNITKLEGFDVSCFNIAISDKHETVSMVSVKPNLTDKYGWYIEGCACVLDQGSPLNIYMKNVDVVDIDNESIDAITFDELVSNSGLNSVDFLQIDTEGYDERILNTIDFEKTKIKFMKFEKHYLSDGFIDTLITKIEPLGFSYYWDNDNYYFLKESSLSLD